jgi:hypothetical protein
MTTVARSGSRLLEFPEGLLSAMSTR